MAFVPQQKNAVDWSQNATSTFNPYNPQAVQMPPWNPIWGEGMEIQPGVQKSIAEQGGYNKFKGEAMRSGPSEWANRATAQQAQQARFARDRGAREVAGQGATARANLAMHGGLGGGAAERIAKSNNKNYLDMSQNIGQEQARNTMQIGMNDEQNRMQQLGMVPGMEMARTDATTRAGQFDVGANMANNQALNQFNQGNYDSIMKAWGNAQVADAQKHSGSSFICTALRAKGLMSKRETQEMTKLMLSGVFARADFFAWYFAKGKEAVERAEQQNFDWSKIKEAYVDDIMKFDFNDPKQLVKAQNMYIERAGAFVTMWLGGRAKFNTEYARPGLIKSLLALPKVFLRPETYAWAYGYYKPRLFKKLSRAKMTLSKGAL